MNIGFTGTKRGMTEAQKESVRYILDTKIKEKGEDEVIIGRHGCCVGADNDFHNILREFPNVKIEGHPGTTGEYRAWCECDVLHEVKPFLERNHTIVDQSNLMIATPGEMNEVLRSGTWATIRYSRKMNKELFQVFPDGTFHRFTYHQLDMGF